ncbi:hypothetical protein ACOMHN_012838 [Nucella lapillus]
MFPELTPFYQKLNDKSSGFSGGSVSQESHQTPSGEDQGQSGQWNKAMKLHQDLLKLHGMEPGNLLQPEDGNSDASGESTTCDSGKGASEEDSHSTGRLSPSLHASDSRGGNVGSKQPRLLSTFHPAGISRTLRSNPLLKQPAGTYPHSSSPSPAYTENGQPVKKVSFHDDIARKAPPSPMGHKHHAVDRWQSPALIGGVAGDVTPPVPPELSCFTQSPYSSLNRHQYANVGGKPGRVYGSFSPRLDLDHGVEETGEDSASTTTSGSYQMELDTLPAPPGSRLHAFDHNSVV